MTPLNELLIQAMEIAKSREPGLSEGKIAARAGVDRATLSRSKHACGQATLAAVLDVLGFDIVLKEIRLKDSKRA
jgi:DNA-binding phage protein